MGVEAGAMRPAPPRGALRPFFPAAWLEVASAGYQFIDLLAPAIRGSDPEAHRTVRRHLIIGHLLPSGRSRAIRFPAALL